MESEDADAPGKPARDIVDGALQAGFFSPGTTGSMCLRCSFWGGFFLSIFNDGELGSPVEVGRVEVGIIFSMTFFFLMKTVVHSLALA